MQADSDANIVVVTLQRAESRNAMSQMMVDELLAALASEALTKAGAIVLTGGGTGFCAGSDLAGLAAMDNAARSAFEAASGLLARTMMKHPRPIVAAVHGFAIGGGCTLAAACDLVVTTPDARWSLPEVPIGLFPAWGLEPVRMRCGRARARRLAFGLDTLSGATAIDWGLADIVATDPLHEALAVATRLAAMPHAQVAAVKRYFEQERTADAADAEANRLFIDACATEAARASFERFGSRRKP